MKDLAEDEEEEEKNRIYERPGVFFRLVSGANGEEAAADFSLAVFLASGGVGGVDPVNEFLPVGSRIFVFEKVALGFFRQVFFPFETAPFRCLLHFVVIIIVVDIIFVVTLRFILF